MDLPKGWKVSTFAEVVTPVVEKEKVGPDTEYHLAGVKWYGEGVFHREDALGKNLSAAYLTPLQPNALIYNRLFAWKASFAIVPEDLAHCHVSNEFPQFLSDADKLEPFYLYLYMSLPGTLDAVNRASIGSAAVSRNRFKEEDFLSLRIPLPPLAVQRAIVGRWRAAQEAVAAAGERIARVERETQARFLADLGLTLPQRATPPKAFAVKWQDLERWGVQLAWQAHRQEHKSKFPMKPLREICKTGSGGTPNRQRKEYYGGGIPWVKTTEVRNNIISTTEETLSAEGLANSSAKLYPAGSIVMAMYGQGATRGRTAKLGIDAATNQACLILTDFTPFLLPDFVWAYLMNRYDDIRALASGNNQPNLSAELIGSFPIPLPPLSVQRAIMERVEAGRTEIAREREAADRLRRETQADVEAMILGAKPVA